MKEEKGFAPIVILIILGIVAALIYGYVSNRGGLKLSFPAPTAASIETVSPTPIQTPKISPTPKPAPTIKPTPISIIDNSFSCGKYDSITKPPLPARGGAPLYVVLYPAGGVSGSHTLVGWQWDYDGNGTWDTDKIVVDPNKPDSGKFPHAYSSKGTFTPKFRAVANNGAVGPTCSYPFDVVVGSILGYQNDMIAVDKLNVEATVSRSKQNYEFAWFEKDFTNGGSNIFAPAFNVSSKEVFTFVGFKEAWNSHAGIYDTGVNLDAGTSANFHLFVNKSEANGTYEGDKTITYTTGPNGTVIKDGPTIHYKITLTD